MYAYTPDVYMQQAASSYPMANSSHFSGYSQSPMAYTSLPMPGSSHQVPEQPQQLQQLQQQQQQIQGFEGATIPQQYFPWYEHMTAMQGAFPASASHPHVPQQPQQLQQIQQQQHIQGFEGPMYPQQYFGWYEHMPAMQSAYPASACHPHQSYHPYTMPPLQSAASDANGRHDGRSTRFIFTKFQVAELKERFNRSDSIKLDERREMGKRIGLSERQIKIWFQNRRFKLRKIKKAQSEAQMEQHNHQDDTMDSGEENDE